jgi:hypothetical protein
VTAPLVDILLPVLGRPWRARPFMEDLVASMPGDVRLIVIASPWDTDTVAAWHQLETSLLTLAPTVILLDQEPGSFAQKINYGERMCREYPLLAAREPAPWIMLVGDDVKPHPGWLPKALAAGARPNVCVVGTDTHGPIPDGQTPHPLIRRSYIAERGASWDGPGSLCHEGYRHNFVDVEIAVLAKNRGVWVDSDAIVEHLARYQGKAPHDGTYAISDETVDEDRRLWEFRQNEYGAVI